MDLPSLIRFGSWFVPIPFMFLYHLKTKKLDFLFPTVCASTIFFYVLPLLLGEGLGFMSSLFQLYILAVFLSFLLFYSKYQLPQALAIAICLTFFASVYWEIPTHIYTIIHRGYIDQAFPLHLLYAFPGVFIWGKIALKKDKINVFLVVLGMVISTIVLGFLLNIGSDIFFAINNPANLRQVTENAWTLNRILLFSTLYLIFYRGVPRVKVCPVPIKEGRMKKGSGEERSELL